MKSFLFDLFFPKKCTSCNKLGDYLCADCLKEIVFIKTATCLTCGKITKKGKFCKTCRPKNSLTGINSAAYFENGPLKELIHSYKYEGLSDAAKLLSSFLIKISEPLCSQNVDKIIITFVPLHKLRLKKRGFNQSEMLSLEIGETLNIPVLPLLIKSKETKSQMGLNRKERQNNLKNSFTVNKRFKNDINKKIVVIVDDIVTTGSTLIECGNTLKEYNPKQIWGLTIGKD